MQEPLDAAPHHAHDTAALSTDTNAGSVDLHAAHHGEGQVVGEHGSVVIPPCVGISQADDVDDGSLAPARRADAQRREHEHTVCGHRFVRAFFAAPVVCGHCKAVVWFGSTT